MRWIWMGLAVLVGFGVAVTIAGTFLPRDHVARKSIRLSSAPERVWGLVSDLVGTARWRTDVKRVEVQSSAGERLRFIEHSSNGPTPFEVVSQDAPRRQVVRVVDDGQPFGGTWTWELVPDGSGTTLSITEAGFVRNPVFRVMRSLFFSPSATIDSYLRALARELGETAEPRTGD